MDVRHPSLPKLMMCTACGTETAYQDLVTQIVDVIMRGRSEPEGVQPQSS